MARRRGMEPMHDEHVNVTPLIDVIMCLIIFFLVAGHLAKAEVSDLIIPRAKYGQEMVDQQGRLPINIVPAHSAAPMAGEIAPDVKGGDINPNAEPEVWVRGRKLAINELAVYLRKEKKDSPDTKIVLRADQSVPYQWIAPVLVACAQADIKNVNFSTKSD